MITHMIIGDFKIFPLLFMAVNNSIIKAKRKDFYEILKYHLYISMAIVHSERFLGDFYHILYLDVSGIFVYVSKKCIFLSGKEKYFSNVIH